MNLGLQILDKATARPGIADDGRRRNELQGARRGAPSSGMQA